MFTIDKNLVGKQRVSFGFIYDYLPSLGMFRSFWHVFGMCLRLGREINKVLRGREEEVQER